MITYLGVEEGATCLVYIQDEVIVFSQLEVELRVRHYHMITSHTETFQLGDQLLDGLLWKLNLKFMILQ